MEIVLQDKVVLQDEVAAREEIVLQYWLAGGWIVSQYSSLYCD